MTNKIDFSNIECMRLVFNAVELQWYCVGLNDNEPLDDTHECMQCRFRKQHMREKRMRENERNRSA